MTSRKPRGTTWLTCPDVCVSGKKCVLVWLQVTDMNKKIGPCWLQVTEMNKKIGPCWLQVTEMNEKSGPCLAPSD